MVRARSQSSKLDELIHLSRERDKQISEMSDKLADLTDQVAAMAPTVRQVADAVTFAKVGRTVFRFLIGMGVVFAPLLLWASDRWHLLGQLFKRVP